MLRQGKLVFPHLTRRRPQSVLDHGLEGPCHLNAMARNRARLISSTREVGALEHAVMKGPERFNPQLMRRMIANPSRVIGIVPKRTEIGEGDMRAGTESAGKLGVKYGE